MGYDLAERVVVGMSGGVDSAVSAAILKEQGYDVIGVTLNLAPKTDEDETLAREDACCTLASVEDARRVADRIGIPYYVLNMREHFEEHVIKDFVDEYRRGRTPNPCIRCNDHVKFGTVLMRATALDSKLVATGHYARIGYDGDSARYTLARGVDRNKDQSYVLYVLTQGELSRTIFPLGGMTKDETRKKARQLRLPVADKVESQDICFIPDRDYRRFLREKAPDLARPGPVVDLDGRVVGEHQGVAFFTVGQRRNLGVQSTVPLYVIEIDASRDTVVVGPADALLNRRLIASDANYVAVPPDTGPIECYAQIRSRMEPALGTLRPTGEHSFEFEFNEPQRAITSGQAIVCYKNDTVLAGGVIERSISPTPRPAYDANPAGVF